VKAGDVVKVRVVEVDAKRKRIGLSMRKDDGSSAPAPREARGNQGSRPQSDHRPSTPKQDPQGAFGAALAEAMKRK
jgi:uncharacterized protein